MSKSPNLPLAFELDENGRAVLPEEVLDAIHEAPQYASAGGLNGSACDKTTNDICTNSQNCDGSDNSQCTNQGSCDPTINTSCPGGTTQPGPGGS